MDSEGVPPTLYATVVRILWTASFYITNSTDTNLATNWHGKVTSPV